MTAALSLAALLVAAAASAHDRPSHVVPAGDVPGKHTTSVTDDSAFLQNDKLFLWRVHWINHSEIQAGEIAKRNGPESITEFGNALVKDHRKAEAALTKLAKKKNLTLELSREEYQRVRESLTQDMMIQMDLAHERGAGFEREFLMHMAEGHHAALRFLRAYREKTNDPDIRAYIDETLPAFQEHHRTANALLDKKQGDRQDVKGIDDGDVEKNLKGVKGGTPRTRKERAEPEEGTDRQEDIETEIERRIEQPADSGGTPDIDPY